MPSNPYTLIGASGMTAAQVNRQNPRPPKPVKPKRPPKPRPPVKPTYTNPFAPLSDAQLQAQASSGVQAGMGPIIKAITDAINQRSASGQQAITGYTHDLANAFSSAAPATKAAYDQAQAAQSGVNTQLANRLGAFGTNLAGEQSQQLASINAPQVTAALTGQTAQTATGAANAGFAQGSAETGKLIAQSAAGQTYGAKLPGIAALTGLQNTRQLQASLNHELATQLSQAQAQAAQQVQASYSHLKDLELQKAIANQSGLYKAGQAQIDKAYKQAQLQYKYDSLNYRKLNDQANRAAKKAAALAKVKAAKKKAAAKQKPVSVVGKNAGKIGSGPGAVAGGNNWVPVKGSSSGDGLGP